MEIATFNPGSVDRRLRRPVLMLKDYLLEDLSSCSSNGFKSFPRYQPCCPITVRFLLENDLKTRGDVAPRRSSSSRQVLRDRSLKRIPSKAASGTISALHRASMRIIDAVKLLTFPSVAKSASSPAGGSKPRRSLLPRSLSRKLLKKRFWLRAEAEEPDIGQWRLYRNILAEKEPPPDQSSPVTGSTTFTARVSTSSSSCRNGGGGSSWDSSESDFSAADAISTSSGNSITTDGDAVVSAGKDLLSPPKPEEETVEIQKEEVSGRVGANVGGIEEVESPGATPTAACSKDWPNEDREHFSPISVLDCPFEDDDDGEEESSSASDHGFGSARKKHGHKGRRIKSLFQLEPLNLDQRLAFSEPENGPPESTRQSLSNPSVGGSCFGVINEIDMRAEELLQAVKIKNPGSGLEEDNLLFDFFIEKLETGCACELEVLEVAVNWVNGAPREIWTRWEVKSRPVAYVRDMEENCKGWRNSNDELEEVAMETEAEVWRSLMEEILLDL